MAYNLDPKILEIIVCPHCHEKINLQPSTITCTSCHAVYPRAQIGQPDLRLVAPKKYNLSIDLGADLNTGETLFGALKENQDPENDLNGIQVPYHLSKELISYFPKSKQGIVLDLGSGSGLHKEVCMQLGFTYIGLDYNSDSASLKGDAHALPFKDASVDFIISIAVLEHIRHPYVMMKEAARVLKPGGTFIGTVSFLEPFHGISYYHHTHMGVFNSLSVAGLKPSHISPTPNWGALRALSAMAFFPRMPEAFTRLMHWPLQLSHVLWWKLGRLLRKSKTSSETYRQLSTAGAFAFIAKKP